MPVFSSRSEEEVNPRSDDEEANLVREEEVTSEQSNDTENEGMFEFGEADPQQSSDANSEEEEKSSKKHDSWFSFWKTWFWSWRSPNPFYMQSPCAWSNCNFLRPWGVGTQHYVVFPTMIDWPFDSAESPNAVVDVNNGWRHEKAHR